MRILEKIIRFARQFMIIIREVYQCERVYLCSMCDGLMNHYHVQLIPATATKSAEAGTLLNREWNMNMTKHASML